MKPVLESVDLMVAVGIVAILGGGLLMVLSTQGRFQASASEKVPHRDTNDPVQQALGQTLVAIAVLEREHAREISKAVKKLNQVTMTAQHIDRASHNQVSELAEQAENVQFGKAARAEFVKGRSIVNSTTRVTKNGLKPEAQREEYDRRMIDVAADAGRKIEKEFQQTRESNLGRAVVNETQRQLGAVHRNQEQVGAAIVLVSLAQDHYREAFETAQEQLGFLVSATAQAQL